MKRICCSGGIGDAYIVYCKLYSRWKKTGETFTLQRYDPVVSYDKPLAALFSNIPFITYKTPAKPFEELEKDLQDKDAHYLGVDAEGKPMGTITFPDPKGYEMTPFPRIAIKKKKLPGTHIGIQLQTGKKIGNFKGFDLSWIQQLIDALPKTITWHLLGTGTNYNLQKVESFCQKNNIKNHVAKTNFTEWLSLITSMDYYLTPEGFSAFFALSQKVQSYIYYVHAVDLRRIHHEQKKYGTFEQVASKVRIIRSLFHLRIIQRINPTDNALQDIKNRFT